MHRPRIKAGLFDIMASRLSRLAGRPVTFFAAVSLVALWGLTGPIFDYSEVWQLVINTSTTIITFLLLFIVQSTQNRDTAALQLKLDAIIYVLTGCDNKLIAAEDLTFAELEALIAEYKSHASDASTHDRSARIRALHVKEGNSA